MNILWLVALKEMRHGLNSQFAYLLFLVFVVSPAIPLFWSATHHNVILSGQADLQAFFGMLPLMLIVFVPALVMRVWAEERRSGTLEILMSLPLDEGHLVLGKFLGVMGFLTLMLALIAAMPYSLLLGTPLDTGLLTAGALGLWLMMAAFAATGIFVSSLTREPAIAAVGGFGTLLAIWLLHAVSFFEWQPIVFGQTPFIATALGVRVENAGDPASRQPGRFRILSRNGAFIETELQTPPGGRIEIELDEGSPTRLRARVAIRNGAGTPMLERWPCGLGVSLSFSSDETRRQVHERIDSDPEAFRLIV